MIIGSFLKKIRTEKGLTLNEVAKNTNLTASLLSQIENDKTSPSLGSLETLLVFYKVNISDFFKQVEQKNIVYIPSSEAETISCKELGVKLTLLASKLERNTLESYRVQMEPGASADLCKFERNFNGERFIYALSGEIETVFEEGSFAMKVGDSINFKTHIACKINNVSKNTTAAFLLSGTPPTFELGFKDKFLLEGKIEERNGI